MSEADVIPEFQDNQFVSGLAKQYDGLVRSQWDRAWHDHVHVSLGTRCLGLFEKDFRVLSGKMVSNLGRVASTFVKHPIDASRAIKFAVASEAQQEVDNA